MSKKLWVSIPIFMILFFLLLYKCDLDKGFTPGTIVLFIDGIVLAALLKAAGKKFKTSFIILLFMLFVLFIKLIGIF
ncbi:MAG: hypothetical protein KHZ62_04100 [Clostridiales bacterium]|nr:hypothetical protein [Clostridiales bacterium]